MVSDASGTVAWHTPILPKYIKGSDKSSKMFTKLVGRCIFDIVRVLRVVLSFSRVAINHSVLCIRQYTIALLVVLILIIVSAVYIYYISSTLISLSSIRICPKASMYVLCIRFCKKS